MNDDCDNLEMETQIKQSLIDQKSGKNSFCTIENLNHFLIIIIFAEWTSAKSKIGRHPPP